MEMKGNPPAWGKTSEIQQKYTSCIRINYSSFLFRFLFQFQNHFQINWIAQDERDGT